MQKSKKLYKKSKNIHIKRDKKKKLELDWYTTMIKKICPFIEETRFLIDSNLALSITNLFLVLKS